MRPLKSYRFVRRWRQYEPGAIVTPTHGVADIWLRVNPPVIEEVVARDDAPPAEPAKQPGPEVADTQLRKRVKRKRKVAHE